ncbi:MAG: SCP2 sterol-binding domain-containing protein [Deltaproteobacteria bacterium]|nr:SCP2 sterol-binding domain-containing protein [Deltaproteobacteria bacterium]
MAFPYVNDRQKADDFLYEFFLKTKTDPDLFEGWKNLGMLVGVQIPDLGLGYTLDCTSGKDVMISRGYPDKPGAALKLNIGVFHDLWIGKLNVVWAFSMRKIKTEGNIASIMKLTSLMPKGIQMYKDYVKGKGIPL